MLRQRFRRPSLELLEDRINPAVLIEIGIDLDGDTKLDDVRITGSTENTIIRIDDEGAGAGSLTIDVDKNGDGIAGPSDVVDFVLNIDDDTAVIELSMGEGNDQVFYRFANVLQTSTRELFIDLGIGDDLFDYDANEAAVQSNSIITLEVLAGPGKDKVRTEFDGVIDSALSADIQMGGGGDECIFLFGQTDRGQIQDGGVVQLDIDLGTGNNSVNSTLNCDVGTNNQGSVDVDVTGGNNPLHRDLVLISLDTEVGNSTASSQLTVDVDLQDGDDTLRFFLTQIEIQPNSVLALRSQGGLGNDNLSAAFTTNLASIVAGGAVFDVELSGGLGDDVISVGTNLADAAQLILNGLWRIHISGNEGNDDLRPTIKVRNSSTGVLNINILCGNGTDEATYFLDKGSSSVTIAPTGKALLNGGKGVDELNLNSDAALVDARLFETFI